MQKTVPFLALFYREGEPYIFSMYILLQNGDAQGEDTMCGKNGFMIGLCALALGLGILITAIFPIGALLFIIAFLLIACGIGCMRR